MTGVEKWLDLKHLGFPHHLVSDTGRVKNTKTGNELFPTLMASGYMRVGLTVNGKAHTRSVHVLMAEVFLVKPDGNVNLSVDHIDRNRSNNIISNLRWATKKEQAKNRRKPIPKSQKVEQRSMDGELIKIWNSAEEIEKFDSSLRAKTIIASCSTKASNRGYMWCFHIETIPGEKWKKLHVDGVGEIFVSDKGRAKRRRNPTFGCERADGYMEVAFGTRSYHPSQLMHRLVAMTFIPNLNNVKQINHVDGNKANNCVENLEWSTCQENILEAYATGLQPKTKRYQNKGVIRIDPNTKEEIPYASMTKAAKENLLKHAGSISVACKKGTLSAGYKWRISK